MDGFSILDPLAWDPAAIKLHPAYVAGNTAACLSKTGAANGTNHYLAGRLYVSKSGWLLLSVPNALVRGVFDAMTAPGAELPLAGALNVPDVKPDLLNAHISVMTAEEVSKIGGDKINERGHNFHYALGPVKEITPKNIDGISRVWAIQVASPELAALRKSYGLSALPNGDHPFHITVAVRRKNVLGANEVAKVDGSRGELKAAAVYNFEGDVQGVSLRKTLHRVLDDLNRPGVMYNNARTSEARAVIPGSKMQREEVLDLLRFYLSTRSGRKGPLQEGVDYKITPLPQEKEKLRKVTMRPADVQKFVRAQGFNQLAAENEDYQKQWLGERYRLQPDARGNLRGAVPDLAHKQLFSGEPVYNYQLTPGWNGTKDAQELLSGGEADHKPDSEFPQEALAEGKKHEREHTDNAEVAKEIAKDHLSEDPAYYEKAEILEKLSNSVYFNQALQAFNPAAINAPIAYDPNKPVFENLRNQLGEAKRRGDFILQTQRNQRAWQSALDPQYRYQLAMQAIRGEMPQPSVTDQLIEMYGDQALARTGLGR